MGQVAPGGEGWGKLLTGTAAQDGTILGFTCPDGANDLGGFPVIMVGPLPVEGTALNVRITVTGREGVISEARYPMDRVFGQYVIMSTTGRLPQDLQRGNEVRISSEEQGIDRRSACPARLGRSET